MSGYYLYAIVLESCPYSDAAVKLLQHNKNIKIQSITRDVKEKYKTDKIQTFPQIYLKRHNHNGSLLIGGYSDISEIYTKFRNKYIKEDVNNYLAESKLKKKTLLRIIEFINQIQ